MPFPIAEQIAARGFPPFSLERLLTTTFAPKAGQRVVILVDLENPSDIMDFTFLNDLSLTIQKHAIGSFYKPLNEGLLAKMGLKGGEIFAYKLTGGSNLDLPDEAFDLTGKKISLSHDVYPNYDIILCISTFSATAPLTAFAKQFGFRGATLHGVNEIILSSGLAVDYNEVSVEAEKLRKGVTKADWVEIDFGCEGETYTLRLTGGRIIKAELIRGNPQTIATHNARLLSDPVTGELGELGFGTQLLPVSGRDIQDEKVRGTLHVATGRSDHLGGHLVPSMFAEKLNATHDDILFAPHKTPEILVKQARMKRGAQEEVLIENYEPSAYLNSLVS